MKMQMPNCPDIVWEKRNDIWYPLDGRTFDRNCPLWNCKVPLFDLPVRPSTPARCLPPYFLEARE